MLTELNLQKFDTVIDKCRSKFQCQIHACENDIVQHFVHLHLMWLILCWVLVKCGIAECGTQFILLSFYV